MRKMLTNAVIVIILRYINVSNQYPVYLKHLQYYVNYMLIKNYVSLFFIEIFSLDLVINLLCCAFGYISLPLS